MLTRAEKWGLRPEGRNPCRKIEKFKERSRERFLSETEIARLGSALAELERSGSPPAFRATVAQVMSHRIHPRIGDVFMDRQICAGIEIQSGTVAGHTNYGYPQCLLKYGAAETSPVRSANPLLANKNRCRW